MNCSFYLALDRLPISLVACIEFVGTIAVAMYGVRSGRNVVALIPTVAGVFILIDHRWSRDTLGLMWALFNGVLFVGYIVLGHRMSGAGAGRDVGRLGAATAIALVFVMPIGLHEALVAFRKGDVPLISGLIGSRMATIPQR